MIILRLCSTLGFYISVLFMLFFSTPSLAGKNSIVTTKIEGDFFDVFENVRMAIVGKGINIAHILPASGMLSKTRTAFGYKNNIYSNAKIVEFCSAKISHKLSRQDPANIVLCPFTNKYL